MNKIVDFKFDIDRKLDILLKFKNIIYFKGVIYLRISFVGEMLIDLLIVFKYVLRKIELEVLELFNNRKLKIV